VAGDIIITECMKPTCNVSATNYKFEIKAVHSFTNGTDAYYFGHTAEKPTKLNKLNHIITCCTVVLAML
jgi:hypothetical protein